MTIQVFKPFYRTQEILELIKECYDIGWTGIGGKMLDFEEAWKTYSGAKTCHMVNSATVGLQLAIMQLKFRHGWVDTDEVITTPLTFVSSNHAILYNGLTPQFADIDNFGCMDPWSVEELINSKTKAILFVGLGGNVGQLKEIMKIAKKHDLRIILDAAHMAGTKWVDTKMQVGCHEGIDVTIFSGQAVKNLPTADSGWVCWNTDDAENMDKELRQLAWLGIDKDTFSRSTTEGNYKWYYDVPHLGLKAHSNAIMGCFGLVGLKYLDKDNAYRRNLCGIYTDLLEGHVEIVPSSKECISSRHLFQILVDKRDEVMMALNQVGIFPGVHYRENTMYEMYDKKSFHHSDIKKAQTFSDRTITLPLHMSVTEADATFVAEQIIAIVSKK